MDPGTFQSILSSLAVELGKVNLRAIKFLVTGIGGINRQRLEDASSEDFILILQERNMISTSDMSFFGELLREIGRRDLYKKVKKVFPDTQACSRLPVAKALMFHIAQSIPKEDLQNAYFRIDEKYDEDSDALELMKLVETREPVKSVEDLRQVISKLGLSHLYDTALRTRAMLRTLSFCDGTGCKEGCVYRPLWSEKFPHQLLPVFNGERLLNHDDVSIDGENTAQEVLGEGTFGKVYKGQYV